MGKLTPKATKSILNRGFIGPIHKMVTNNVYSVDPDTITSRLWNIHAFSPASQNEIAAPKYNEIFRHLLKNHTPQELSKSYGTITGKSDEKTRSMLIQHHIPHMDQYDHVDLARLSHYNHEDHHVQSIVSHPDVKKSTKSEIERGFMFWRRRDQQGIGLGR